MPLERKIISFIFKGNSSFVIPGYPGRFRILFREKQRVLPVDNPKKHSNFNFIQEPTHASEAEQRMTRKVETVS
jgi:hypothetical protein